MNDHVVVEKHRYGLIRALKLLSAVSALLVLVASVGAASYVTVQRYERYMQKADRLQNLTTNDGRIKVVASQYVRETDATLSVVIVDGCYYILVMPKTGYATLVHEDGCPNHVYVDGAPPPRPMGEEYYTSGGPKD